MASTVSRGSPAVKDRSPLDNREPHLPWSGLRGSPPNDTPVSCAVYPRTSRTHELVLKVQRSKTILDASIPSRPNLGLLDRVETVVWDLSTKRALDSSGVHLVTRHGSTVGTRTHLRQIRGSRSPAHLAISPPSTLRLVGQPAWRIAPTSGPATCRSSKGGTTRSSHNSSSWWL